MAQTDIEVEGLYGKVFAFPAGTADGVMRTALIRHYQGAGNAPAAPAVPVVSAPPSPPDRRATVRPPWAVD